MSTESRHANRNNPSSSVKVVRLTELSSLTPQTSGSQRMSAISAMQGVASSLWAGMFLVEPSATTDIHHHGQQETIAYVLDGEAIVRWGDHGEHSVTVSAGDFLHVPSWLPHQELNPSDQHPFRWIVVRSTPEPIVINLPDDFWAEEQEPNTERRCR